MPAGSRVRDDHRLSFVALELPNSGQGKLLVLGSYPEVSLATRGDRN